MTPHISDSKNIVYNSTLIAQGNIQIGDKIIYQGRKEQHVILYLKLHPKLKKDRRFTKKYKTNPTTKAIMFDRLRPFADAILWIILFWLIYNMIF